VTGRRRAALPRPLPDEAIELIAARLKVIAEPTRIRLMGLLNEREATVQELTDRLPTTHQNVSKHLAALYQAGMVSRRTEGSSVHYALVDWTGWWLVEQMAASVAARLDELHGLFTAKPGDRDEGE
jgi:DNA-binding transcriptional ArsR family regulator